MRCHRCRGCMLVDYHIDMEDDQGMHWLRAWHCTACDVVLEPEIAKRRLTLQSRLKGLVERVNGWKRQTYEFEIVKLGS